MSQAEQERKDWCNCQAIPGTGNYPGPWHEFEGEPHYPCTRGAELSNDDS